MRKRMLKHRIFRHPISLLFGAKMTPLELINFDKVKHPIYSIDEYLYTYQYELTTMKLLEKADSIIVKIKDKFKEWISKRLTD